MSTRKIESENFDFTGNITFIADKVKFLDAANTAKVAKLDCSGITAGQESVITIPDTDSTSALLGGTQTFTGDKTFSGTTTLYDTALIVDADSVTRKARIDAGSITAGQTRVITLPDYNFTPASLAGTETLSAKTLTSPALTAQATDVAIGAVAGSGVAVTIARVGNFFYLTFTLTAVQIAVTDAGASGSYGAQQIFTFVEGGLTFLGCRQNYTAYAPDGTGVPDDDNFVIGLGTTAISAAADGVLAAGEQNVGASLAQTLSGGTTTGTKFTGAGSAFDGTSSAASLYLNFSGDAATTDGNGTIDVTGTITVVGALLGDD